MSIITPLGRLSYPKIVDPEVKEREDGSKTMRYGASLVFTESLLEESEALSSATLKEMKQAAFAVVVEKFGKKQAEKMLKDGSFRLQGGPNHTFRTDVEGKGYPDDAEAYINTASWDEAPQVVDGAKNELTGEELKRRLFPGAVVRFSVTPYWFERQGNRGVAWGLNNIQYVRDDERIDGRVSAAEEFDEVAPTDISDVATSVEQDGSDEEAGAPEKDGDSAIDELLG